MPRSKTGKKRPKVNITSLELAIEDVINGKESISSAATSHNISKTTLLRHLALHRKSGSVSFTYCSNIAHKQIFTNEEELLLVQYLSAAAKLHYGLSKLDTMKLAFRYGQANNKAIPPSWVKNEAAGMDWMNGFLKRHPVLSLRKPEATSLSRLTSFNKTNVESFFKNLKDCISRFKICPDKIFNLDETGNSTVHVPPKVLATRGEKQVGSMTSGERGINVTMIAAVSAIGNHVPPMLIFPRVHFKEHMLSEAPTGSIGGANPSGWSNEKLFVQYLKHFIAHVKPTPEEKVLLIMDNHDTHISVTAINLAREFGVVLLTLPPHCSHKMQPLDRTVFGPYKTYFNKATSEWMLMNPGKPMSIYNIASIVGKAYSKAFNQQNIIKGFKVTGIWPVDEHIFQEDEFLGSYVTDRPCPDGFTAELPANVDSLNVALPNTHNPLAESSNTQASTSNSTFKSPEVIKPFPKAPPRKYPAKRGRKKGKTRILTDTPEKDDVETSTSKKSNSRGRKAVKKKVLEESSESDDIIGPSFNPRTPKPRKVKQIKKSLEQNNDSSEDFSGEDGITIDEILRLVRAKY